MGESEGWEKEEEKKQSPGKQECEIMVAESDNDREISDWRKIHLILAKRPRSDD